MSAAAKQWSYEHALRHDLPHQAAALKYHNRAAVLQALGFWATVQSPRTELAAPEAQVPVTAAVELVAEGYAAGAWRRLRPFDGKET